MKIVTLMWGDLWYMFGSMASQAHATRCYADIHAAPGYGARYEQLYERGYEHAQWTQLESPLLRGIFRERFDLGARRLLDVACGTGRILGLAEDVFPTTWGVDVSTTMLEVAGSRCRKSTLVTHDIAKGPVSEQFDVVTAFRFFLGAEPELRARALDAIAAMLAPGGVLVANIHVNRSSPMGLAYRSVGAMIRSREGYTLGLPEFRGLLERHGFGIRQLHWYSYLPRTGQWLRWLPRYAMRPVETLCKRVPLVPPWVAQSFLVVCDRSA